MSEDTPQLVADLCKSFLSKDHPRNRLLKEWKRKAYDVLLFGFDEESDR